jgi:general secretion pathway protein K
MLTVTLVATLAATALWQQWRAVEIETAERARMQSAWILIGALDWSRLILREDGRANSSSSTDHLAEPWAVPLQEARLSTFLAADRNVSQAEDASADVTEAFLSGQITDMQSRLNLTNLIVSGEVALRPQRQMQRLFERLNLPPQELTLLLEGLRAAQAAGDNNNAPLMPRTVQQLGWLGLQATTVALLQPHVTILPSATSVNLNTATPEVLWASIEGLDESSAQKLVQTRASKHFRNIQDAQELLGNNIRLRPEEHSVASSYFEVLGRLRLGDIQVQERSLVNRKALNEGGQTTTVWRERVAPAVSP